MKIRAAKVGLVGALIQAVGIVAVDCFRAISSKVLRYGVFTPLRLLSKLSKDKKKKQQQHEQQQHGKIETPATESGESNTQAPVTP